MSKSILVLECNQKSGVINFTFTGAGEYVILHLDNWSQAISYALTLKPDVWKIR